MRALITTAMAMAGWSEGGRRQQHYEYKNNREKQTRTSLRLAPGLGGVGRPGEASEENCPQSNLPSRILVFIAAWTGSHAGEAVRWTLSRGKSPPSPTVSQSPALELWSLGLANRGPH
ncbi:unnamed protein product [Boreogadus saida]